MMKNKSFDCVKMTRDIRDKLYEQNKGKSLREFADTLVKEAHKSLLWKKVKLVDKTRTVIISK
ncbi:MAG: hypothetical protein NUV76_05145 [Candidatus Kuenenia sp.]|nr:hypothetical protein [Candidatus Kuenenia sp.]